MAEFPAPGRQTRFLRSFRVPGTIGFLGLQLGDRSQSSNFGYWTTGLKQFVVLISVLYIIDLIQACYRVARSSHVLLIRYAFITTDTVKY